MSVFGTLVKISNFALKSGVVIAKTKVKTYIFKIKFLLINFLTKIL